MFRLLSFRKPVHDNLLSLHLHFLISFCTIEKLNYVSNILQHSMPLKIVRDETVRKIFSFFCSIFFRSVNTKMSVYRNE